MTLAYREMQQPRNKELFQLEIVCQFHRNQTLNDFANFVMGKQCQKI